jgi:hypothetical protein
MVDYRKLSTWEQNKVDKMILTEIEPGPRINKSNGFKWIEPDYTLGKVHRGDSCAECLNSYYNCVC